MPCRSAKEAPVEGPESYHADPARRPIRAVCSLAMTPDQARDLKAELEVVSREARSVVAGLESAALTKRPADGGWSVAEILQHLILTADAMLPLIEGALAQLQREGRKSTATSGLGLMGWLLVKALEPPPRMKSKTSKPFEPVTFGDPLTLAGQLIERNARLGAAIDRAQGLATTAAKIASPFNASVKYNVYAALRITLVHARRHLWQARALRQNA